MNIALRIGLGVVLGAFLVAMTLAALAWLDMQREQRGWRPVPCVVERSAVLVEDAPQVERRRGGPSRPWRRYEIDVVYRYEVDGAAHVGGTYSQVNSWLRRSSAEAAQREVAAGTRTTCLVDPGYPARSVLRLEQDHAPVWFLAALSMLPLAGIWLLAGRPRPWRRRH